MLSLFYKNTCHHNQVTHSILHRPIINELLDFSRVKALQREVTAIDDWLAEVVDEYVIPKAIALQYQFASVVEVDFDHDRFHRVIVNILDNAVQAMSV